MEHGRLARLAGRRRPVSPFALRGCTGNNWDIV